LKHRFTVIIPARFDSTRLPGKPLAMIGNKTLLEHVYENARKSGAAKIVIATDDERIDDEARSFGAHVVMTSRAHRSGTDRVNEAAGKLKLSDDEIVVNLQGDEYGMAAKAIDLVAEVMESYPERKMATLCQAIEHEQEYLDPNSVKVIIRNNKCAMYFSRAPIPWTGQKNTAFPTDGTGPVYRHIGIYGYRAGFLRLFSALPPCGLEKLEALEQLRALYHGYEIHVEEIESAGGIEINTREDLTRARRSTL